MKIDMREVQQGKLRLRNAKITVEKQLQATEFSIKKIASSNELSGKVKEAINAEIANCQVPLLKGYRNSLYSLEKGYNKLIQTFKQEVKETSNSAYLDTNILVQMEAKFSPSLTEFLRINQKLKSAYTSVSDLVSLDNVNTSNFEEKMHRAKKILTETRKAVGNFTYNSSALSEELNRQNTQVSKLAGTLALGYNDPASLAIFQDQSFKNDVEKAYKANKAEKERLKRAEEERMKEQHLAEEAKRTGVNKTKVNELSKEVNQTSGIKGEKKKKADEKNVKKTKGSPAADFGLDMVQSVNEEALQHFFDSYGSGISSSLYATSTKFVGSSASSAFYAGGKFVGGASKAVPILGVGMDFGGQIASGENTTDAVGKTGAHVIASVGIGVALAAFGLSGGAAIAGGFLVGWAVNKWIVDPLYDKTKEVIGDACNSIGKWVGNVFT